MNMADTGVDLPALKEECTRFYKQCEARYGRSMIVKIYREEAEAVAGMVAGLARSRISAKDLLDVRTWLLMGLKPFVEYPPSQESLVQMASLLRQYPIEDAELTLRDSWYRLDTDYGYRYGKNWRGETGFQGLERERVWIADFMRHKVDAQEIQLAMNAIEDSGLFRLFSPMLDQFIDVIYAIRKKYPMVEVAWHLSTNGRSLDAEHPVVRRVAGITGVRSRSQAGFDRDLEARFKSTYRNILRDTTLQAIGHQDEAFGNMEEKVEMASPEEVIQALG